MYVISFMFVGSFLVDFDCYNYFIFGWDCGVYEDDDIVVDVVVNVIVFLVV